MKCLGHSIFMKQFGFYRKILDVNNQNSSTFIWAVQIPFYAIQSSTKIQLTNLDNLDWESGAENF